MKKHNVWKTVISGSQFFTIVMLVVNLLILRSTNDHVSKKLNGDTESLILLGDKFPELLKLNNYESQTKTIADWVKFGCSSNAHFLEGFKIFYKFSIGIILMVLVVNLLSLCVFRRGSIHKLSEETKKM